MVFRKRLGGSLFQTVGYLGSFGPFDFSEPGVSEDALGVAHPQATPARACALGTKGATQPIQHMAVDKPFDQAREPPLDAKNERMWEG